MKNIYYLLLALMLLPHSAAFAADKIDQDGNLVAYSDGTIIDTQTALMWVAYDNGNDFSWAEAAFYVEEFKGGGYKDWRLPSKEELASLFTKNTKNSNGIGISRLFKVESFLLYGSETRTCKAVYLDFLTGGTGWMPRARPDFGRVIAVRNIQP